MKHIETIKAAKEWLLDCAASGDEEEFITCWLMDASEEKIIRVVNRRFDGGWAGFLLTF